MKLLRWAMAGASAYAVYKYSIGKKAKGEAVLASPEKLIADLTGEPAPDEAPATPGKSTAPAKPRKARSPKGPKQIG